MTKKRLEAAVTGCGHSDHTSCHAGLFIAGVALILALFTSASFIGSRNTLLDASKWLAALVRPSDAIPEEALGEYVDNVAFQGLNKQIVETIAGHTDPPAVVSDQDRQYIQSISHRFSETTVFVWLSTSCAILVLLFMILFFRKRKTGMLMKQENKNEYYYLGWIFIFTCMSEGIIPIVYVLLYLIYFKKKIQLRPELRSFAYGCLLINCLILLSELLGIKNVLINHMIPLLPEIAASENHSVMNYITSEGIARLQAEMNHNISLFYSRLSLVAALTFVLAIADRSHKKEKNDCAMKTGRKQ